MILCLEQTETSLIPIAINKEPSSLQIFTSARETNTVHDSSVLLSPEPGGMFLYDGNASFDGDISFVNNEGGSGGMFVVFCKLHPMNLQLLFYRMIHSRDICRKRAVMDFAR